MIELFVPGRLCLFGEHSDWAGQMRKFNSEILPGQALVVCTEEGIHANAKASDILRVTSLDNDGNRVSAEYAMELPVLQKAAASGSFFSYIAGVAAYMLNYYQIGGIELNVTKMTLPQKKGLSSSAAICALTARAFNKLYGLNLTTRGEMECAYGGEQLTPSRCGRLDQAVAYGRGIVKMVFNGDQLDVSPVRVGAPLYIVFADLKAKKNTLAILRDLNAAYPYPKTAEHNALHELLGKENEHIVREAENAISKGDAQRIGKLMAQAQDLFRQYAAPLSQQELSSPKLYSILHDTMVCHWVFGGKGVGSQGDGTVQFIAKSEADAEKLKTYLTDTLGLDAYSVTVPKTEAVRKAVIPLAGSGTRMYPATRFMKKEFLPVVDFDGRAKPALQVLVDSIRESGIEQICLVIRHGDEEQYRMMFNDSVEFTYQDAPLGFGHAVLQSEKFSDGEPVLVLLGDHLFTSGSEKSCITQLIDVYENFEQLTIGLFEIPLDDTPHYGIAKVKSENDGVLQLSALVEKPNKVYSQNELSHNGKYYGIFMYVITPKVYTALKKGFADWDAKGEYQFTDALDAVTCKFGAIGNALVGDRYDIGIPEQYRRTVSEFGKTHEEKSKQKPYDILLKEG